jgi:hypothetical protein
MGCFGAGSSVTAFLAALDIASPQPLKVVGKLVRQRQAVNCEVATKARHFTLADSSRT